MTEDRMPAPDPSDNPREDPVFAEVFRRHLEDLMENGFVDPDEIVAEHPALGPAVLEDLQTYIALNPEQAADPQKGPLSTLGDYTLRRQIGRGGMGVVYEAWENSMDRRVALKVLPAGIAADDRAFHRFLQEAKTAGKLSHPNVVPVYAMGVREQTPYFAMEFVEGETLAQVLMKLQEQPAVETPFGRTRNDQEFYLGVARCFADVADGLQHAHSKGIIHRDIKPSNLILDGEGTLRILDFGLARLEGQESFTASGDLVGTPQYMSPEQARRKKIAVDHRTDIYSLGATLYEILTLRPPFQGKDYQDTLSQIIERDAVEPSRVNSRVPRDLETIVLKCLRKDAGDRYGTAEALGQDLRRFVRGDVIEARPQSTWERTTLQLMRHRRKLAAGLVVSVLAFACVILASRLALETKKTRRSFELEAERRIVAASMKVLRGETSLSGNAKRSSAVRLLAEFFPNEWAEYVRETGETTIEAAIQELTAATADLPQCSEGHYWLGRALHLRERDDLALVAFGRALRCRPGFTPARALMDEVRGAVMGGFSGPDESSWGAIWIMAHRASTTGRWQDALEAYGILIALDEQFELRGDRLYLGSLLEHLLARGVARLEFRDFEGAKRDFWAARTISRGEWGGFLEPDLLLGKTYCVEGEAREADALFRDVFEQSLAKEEVALWIAGVYRSIGENAAALEWAKHVSTTVGDRLRVDILRALGSTAEALEAQRCVMAHDPRDLKAHLAFGRLLLQDLWQRREADRSTTTGQTPAEFRELTELSERVLALGPRSPAAHALASDISRARGDLERAGDLTRSAIALAAEASEPETTTHTERNKAMRGSNPRGAALMTVLSLFGKDAKTQEIVEVSDCIAGHFQEPEPLELEINSPFWEMGPSLSSDYEELFFGSTRHGTFDLFSAQRGEKTGEFIAVRSLDELNTSFARENNPRISRDGLRLYFNGGPINGGGTLHVASRERPENPFSRVRPLDEINEAFPSGVTAPAVSEDEREIYFTVVGTVNDLAMAWRQPGEETFSSIRVLDEINTASYDESNPGISADGLTLFWSNWFNTNPPPEGPGDTDIWFARRTKRFDAQGNPVPFESAQRLPGPVNTAIAEVAPSPTWDWPAPGSALYFIRCVSSSCNLDIHRAAWVPTPRPGCHPNGVPYVRGDANADRSVDLSDAIFVLNWLFVGEATPQCLDTADTNGDGQRDLSDAVNVLNVLFLGTGAIPPPHACGDAGIFAELGSNCRGFSGC